MTAQGIVTATADETRNAARCRNGIEPGRDSDAPKGNRA